MKNTGFLMIALALLLPPQSRAAREVSESFYAFGANCDPSRITQSPDMDRLLRAVALKVGHRLRLDSCFRSQARQNSILQNHHCQPFGPNNCSGTVARQSQHTMGVAADFHSRLDDGPLCHAMDQARTEVRGGKGGVGGYGSGFAHVDIRAYHCNWNICKKYLGACTDSGYATYVSTVVNDYERNEMMKDYTAAGNDSTNPDNVEDFFLLRFFKNMLGSIDDFVQKALGPGLNQ